MNTSAALAQKHPFDPWKLPDSYSVWDMAPEDVQAWMHPHWKTQKPVHPIYSYFFGLYYLVLGTAAVTGNITVLRIFGKYKSLRSPANVLVMNLAISDMLLMFGLIPEAVYNFMTGGAWKFGWLGCQIHAFCGACFGYSQITTLTFITWDRYNVIVKGLAAPPLTYSKVTWLIIINWIISIGLAIGPFFGWGYYTVNGMLGTCAFDGYTQDWGNKSMILFTSIFGYGANIIYIMWVYYYIVKAVFKHEEELRSQAKKMNVASLRSNEDANATRAEIRTAKIALIASTLWALTWTPFTVVYMVGSWGDPSGISPLVTEIPVIFAKTSAVYNPIVYALSHPKYRQCLKEMYPWMCVVIDDKKKRNDDNQSVVTETTQ
jgi:r-opsin